MLSQNFMMLFLVHLLHIQEVLGLNLSPETDYLIEDFLWFSSVYPDKCSASTTVSFYIIPNSTFTINLPFSST
jgi:hypothetical protein